MIKRRTVTYPCHDIIDPLEALLGTPKHAYEVLRLKEVGLDFGLFYRAWRSSNTTGPCARALIEVYRDFEDVLKNMFEENGRIVAANVRVTDEGVAAARRGRLHEPPWEKDEDEDA